MIAGTSCSYTVAIGKCFFTTMYTIIIWEKFDSQKEVTNDYNFNSIE